MATPQRPRTADDVLDSIEQHNRAARGETYVTRADDDSDCPITGLVIGWEDEDRCLVAWGDAKYAPDPTAEARIENMDELRPHQRRRNR